MPLVADAFRLLQQRIWINADRPRDRDELGRVEQAVAFLISGNKRFWLPKSHRQLRLRQPRGLARLNAVAERGLIEFRIE